jgi:hypothetical protein
VALLCLIQLHIHIEPGYFVGEILPAAGESAQQRHVAGRKKNGRQPAEDTWMPDTSPPTGIPRGVQPYFKLHGSSNWRDTQDLPLYIAGGNKPRLIAQFPAIKWCHDEFEKQLMKSDTRLLVIGYSFADDHINESIIKAVNETKKLRFFVIDPSGHQVVYRANSSYGESIYDSNTPLDQAFHAGLMGATSRPLFEAINSDDMVFSSVKKFLQLP